MDSLATTGRAATAAKETVVIRRRMDWGRAATVVFFLLPAALIYGLFVLYPIVQAAFYSLYRWKGLGPLQDYVGLQNFRQILTDEVFRQALGHNLIIMVLSLGIQLPLALGIALLVGRKMRGRAFFRTVFFLPFVLSEVITGVVWSFILRAQSGLLNSVLDAIVPGFTPRGWLGNPDIVLYVLFAVITWKYFGFHMILYLAGLQSIPAELEEAALIDGATPARVIRDVTIPLLLPTIRLTIFLSALGSLQFFDLIYIMTDGGPVNASETMATYMYDFGFRRFSLGYGAAVSLVIFAICFLFSLAYQRTVMNREVAGALS
jgi:raffinose/stachyose/melibiose transport system permease protein